MNVFMQACKYSKASFLMILNKSKYNAHSFFLYDNGSYNTYSCLSRKITNFILPVIFSHNRYIL